MNIYITPVLKKIKSETYLCIDKNLIKFLKETFKNPNIEFSEVIKNKPHLIVFAGGNNLTHLSKSKEDKIRNNINLKTFNYGLKKKIKMIGICAGAQFIAKKFGSTISKLKGHIGNHEVIFSKKFNKKYKKKITVNSFHNYGIKKLYNYLTSLACAEDDSIELFMHKEKKIIGIMWHPERYKKFKKVDKFIFRNKLWI
jgi:N5-(cytidine 5'-diphosphoramidyl)-L-glutamine hydrolase